jgi:CBS domain-containing protein
MRLLELSEVSGLPVVDGAGRLVGVISQTDLLRGASNHRAPARRGHPVLRVADLMTSPAITVELMTPLSEAARLMLAEKVHRVVAVNAAGHPIGVLSSMDFVGLYADD